MLIKSLYLIFILISFVLACMIVVQKLIMCKIKDNIKKSDFVAAIAVLFFLYVLFALLLVIFTPVLMSKFIMLVFALSPFIIGRLATFKSENFYSILQVLIILISGCYIFII